MDRDRAIDRVAAIVEAVDIERMPVPIREVWVYGELALGLDPIDRLDIYVTKDLLFGGDDAAEARFAERYGVTGIGKTVSAEWAETHPEYVRANDHGHAAPEDRKSVV